MGVINGFNCSFIASQTIKSLEAVNLRRVRIFLSFIIFLLQKQLRTNEEIFISVSIKNNYDIFNISQRNSDSAEKTTLINAIKNNFSISYISFYFYQVCPFLRIIKIQDIGLMSQMERHSSNI